MLTRYLITRGASTSAGGKVIEANSVRFINDVPVAYADDPVSCPKCNTVGVIKPDGPRLSDIFNGRQVALSDDLCICKCNPPPRLVADQFFVCQEIDGEWHASEAGTAAEAAAQFNSAESSATSKDRVPLVLLDPDTHEPFRHRPYRIELTDTVIEGTTDQNGATRPLTAAERTSVLTWHVDHG